MTDEPVFLGTRVDMSMEKLPGPYQKLEDQIHAVLGQYSSGTLEADDALDELAKLKIRDPYGNLWTIGATTGRWMKKEAGTKRWVPDHPAVIS